MPKKRKHAMPRVVPAPVPVIPAGAPLPPNRVEFVVLAPGEDVAWTWTSSPNGTSYVSGFTIFKSGRIRTGSRKGRRDGATRSSSGVR